MKSNKAEAETIWEYVIALIIMIIFFIIVALGTDTVMDNHEKDYCLKLQEQASQMKDYLYSEKDQWGFFITKQDDILCQEIHKIKIDAPIKLY